MAAKTPLHAILAEEAKSRSFRRSGASWLKDFGDLVAEIRLYGRTHFYHCATSLFLKLDGITVTVTELNDGEKSGDTIRITHLVVHDGRCKCRLSDRYPVVQLR